METDQLRSRIVYIVMSVLFIVTVVFNDFIGIAGIHPDILLIMLFFLAMNEKPLIAIIMAFVFGFLQDIFLPGTLQYWGLSPLFKTLIVFGLIKLLPFWYRLKGFLFYLSIFGAMLSYSILYDLLYYSGYVKPLVILYRYAIPETLYTFAFLLIVSVIFPLKNRSNK
ncbi:MAG: hypothetical protein JXR21_00630 [Candidatus Marinimicrobia bacterium]|nr:hypothetical protein [Candidatus Neomarinimicrobiota bacterium]